MAGRLVWFGLVRCLDLMSTKFTKWINSCGRHSRVIDQSTTAHMIYSFILSAFITCHDVHWYCYGLPCIWSILIRWIIEVIKIASSCLSVSVYHLNIRLLLLLLCDINNNLVNPFIRSDLFRIFFRTNYLWNCSTYAQLIWFITIFLYIKIICLGILRLHWNGFVNPIFAFYFSWNTSFEFH